MLVSVVLDPGHDDELRAVSLATAREPDAHRLGGRRRPGRASGEYVAFLDAGDSWVPDRLERLVGLARPFVADELEGERGNGEKVVFRTPAPDVEPARLVARREALLGLGPVDPALPVAWLLDLLMRGATEVGLVPAHRRTPPVPGPPPRAPAAARRLAPGRAQQAPGRLGRPGGAGADGRADQRDRPDLRRQRAHHGLRRVAAALPVASSRWSCGTTAPRPRWQPLSMPCWRGR